MNFTSSLIENAVLELSRLPGIGKKTALRLALHLLKMEPGEMEKFSESLLKMHRDIKTCTRCHSVSDAGVCQICSNPGRNQRQICVVESIRDVMAIEATQHYSGLYHLLGGVISPLDGVGPDQLNIESLINRIKAEETEEIIFALNANIQGDTTIFFINKKLEGLPLKITAISRGIAFGGELEYADEMTLARSIMSRLPVEGVVQG